MKNRNRGLQPKEVYIVTPEECEEEYIVEDLTQEQIAHLESIGVAVKFNEEPK